MCHVLMHAVWHDCLSGSWRSHFGCGIDAWSHCLMRPIPYPTASPMAPPRVPALSESIFSFFSDLMIGRRNEAASRATTPSSTASRCGCLRLTLAMRPSSTGGEAFAFSSCSILSSSFCASGQGIANMCLHCPTICDHPSHLLLEEQDQKDAGKTKHESLNMN